MSSRAAHRRAVSKWKCLGVLWCWGREPLVKWSTATRAHRFPASATSRRPPTDLLHVTPPVCLTSPPQNLCCDHPLWATLGWGGKKEKEERQTARDRGRKWESLNTCTLPTSPRLPAPAQRGEEDAQVQARPCVPAEQDNRSTDPKLE